MIVKTVDRSSISTNSLVNNIGLCYFDPETEQLTEIGSNSTVRITPFETGVRRYYLVKTSDILFGKRFNMASITIKSKLPSIDLKVLIGVNERVTEIPDYYETEINNTIVVPFSEHPSGIIPLDIMFKSNTNENIDTSFDINLRLI